MQIKTIKPIKKKRNCNGGLSCFKKIVFLFKWNRKSKAPQGDATSLGWNLFALVQKDTAVNRSLVGVCLHCFCSFFTDYDIAAG